MKRFCKKIFFYLLLIVFIFYIWCIISDHAVEYYKGPTTSSLITKAFKEAKNNKYDSFLIGNSRIYRDINPEFLKNGEYYNFGHDNDSFNQCYYKLLYLESTHQNIKNIIMGVDYFEFSFLVDTRNYCYDFLLGFDYMNDYGKNHLLNYASDIKNYITIKNSTATKQMVLDYYVFHKNPIDLPPFLRDNGQYVVKGLAKDDESIERDWGILDIQRAYFQKIVKNCIDNNINLFLVMPPCRDAEYGSHTDEEKKAFDDMIRSYLPLRYKNNYYNLSNLTEFKSVDKYIDITHLNPKAADEFSIVLNKEINQ